MTNGSCLARFRRGGFISGVAVRPVITKYEFKLVNPEMTNIKGFETGMLIASDMNMNVAHMHAYPTFVPNDYLYSEYAKTIEGYEKMEKWEIYAHAVHDFMRIQGGFKSDMQPLREKVELQKFLWGEIDELKVHGKTFYWPPRNVSKESEKDK